MEKWTLPLSPVPSWLDPSREVLVDPPKLPKNEFVVLAMNTCIHLGCDPRQAAGVTGNILNESAWGQSYRAWNIFGWKCTKSAAIAYALAHDGMGIRFWRARGNKAPGATPEDPKGGDPPTVIYRAFDSLEEAIGEWLKHFVPRPDATAPYKGYKHCGELFWSHGDWMRELIRVGYKGTNTKKNPEPSIREHESLTKAALIRWAQSRLGVVVDGKWGPKSRAACIAFQTSRGLSPTGQLDDETIRLLATQ